MFGVTPGPFVIPAGAFSKFVHDFEARKVQRIFVVRQMRPQPAASGLVEMPVRSLHGFNGQLDARSAVSHVDVERRQGCTGVFPVWALLAMRGQFFHLDPSEALGALMLGIVEQATLGQGNVLNVSIFPGSGRTRRDGGRNVRE